MRNSFCTLFIFIYVVSWSQEKADSSVTKLKAYATVSLNSNGIASIPAFSLGDPAIMASVSLVKNRFSYDPTLAYGFNMKPWFIDNWLHYKIIRKPSWELRTGFNISSFFSEYQLDDDKTILEGQRYFALELAATYRFSPNSSLSFMYWNDNGYEPGSISGHFFNLVGERTDIKIGNRVLMGINIQLFCITYDGNNDGLFITPKISSSLINVPLSLFFQATQPLVTNVTPYPGFQWNVGLAYTL